jgi:predicted AAA+ superfamily ATPase
LEGKDLRGKKILRFQSKVYLADHGFREAHLPSSNVHDIDQTLENIVCIELLRRGWTLSFGDVNGKEIDFIAERNSQRLYVQVTYLLASETTIEREFAPLMLVQDNWPKMVLSMDQVNFSRNGIVHQNILDFLLGR